MTLQPVGPLPASTYWRRRVLVGVVVLLALVLVLRACGGSSESASLVSGSPSPSPSAAPLPSPVTPSPSPSPTSPPSPLPPAACGDAALTVTVESDAASYKKGAAPRFTLTVTNTSSVACRRALGPDVVEIRVFSGEDRIWSSDDCGKGKGQGVLLLGAGEARALTVQWPGKRTKPDCVTGAVALPGTYRVSVKVGPILRQGSVFQITA